jgi:hypothetical protein
MRPVQECQDDLQSQGDSSVALDCGRYRSTSLCRTCEVADEGWESGSSSGCPRSCRMSVVNLSLPFGVTYTVTVRSSPGRGGMVTVWEQTDQTQIMRDMEQRNDCSEATAVPAS